ncbi:hypothetical protein [Pseudotabrizicola alkalilacus]|uniref:hypothetical protein n=1 Tax=Pseudotabrizicola alkalilacus TaxID=2305252 RepID=UPI0011C1845F|nr:hypothetical protein [Pseudotabrizicola alkalilacus]
MNLTGYDAWKLSPPDDPPSPGDEEGQTCNRFSEPDEDAPRGHRAKPCPGTMVFNDVEGCSCHISPPCGACVNNPLVCDTCGEEA